MAFLSSFSNFSYAFGGIGNMRLDRVMWSGKQQKLHCGHPMSSHDTHIVGNATLVGNASLVGHRISVRNYRSAPTNWHSSLVPLFHL